MIGRREETVTKPILRQDYPLDKFPITIRLLSGKTGAVVWSRTVTLDEARTRAKVEIPSFTGTEHYPVLAEIVYADGTPAPADADVRYRAGLS